MSNKENFKLTVSDEGPVRISSRARQDLTWLAKNNLEELPQKLSTLKKVNQNNQDLSVNFWKNFPVNYQVDLKFIDERSDPGISYAQAQKNVVENEKKLGSPFMRGGAQILEDGSAQAMINIYVHPYHANDSLQSSKWDEGETLYAISAMKHEFSHATQSILANILAKSELDTSKFWHHFFVVPFFCLEGYALVHEGSSTLDLERERYVAQPLLRKAVRIEEIGRSLFKVNKEFLFEGLNSWKLQTLNADFTDRNKTERMYTLGQAVYLSLIGLRAGVSPRDMIEETRSTNPYEASKSDLVSISIQEKSHLISKPFAKWIEDQSNQIELEMQSFYYRNYSDLAWAGDAVRKQFKERDPSLPKKVEDLNKAMLTKITQGFEERDLIEYANNLIIEMANFGKNSPYFDQKKSKGVTRLRHISVYSDKKENPYYPILQRKFYLDGISDDTSYGRE